MSKRLRKTKSKTNLPYIVTLENGIENFPSCVGRYILGYDNLSLYNHLLTEGRFSEIKFTVVWKVVSETQSELNVVPLSGFKSKNTFRMKIRKSIAKRIAFWPFVDKETAKKIHRKLKFIPYKNGVEQWFVKER